MQDQHGKLERQAGFPIESSLVEDVRGVASQVNLSSAVRRIRCGVIIHKVVPSSSPCGHKNAVCRFGGRRRDVVLLFHKKYDSSWTMNLVPALLLKKMEKVDY